MKLRKFFSAAIIAAMIMTVFGTDTYAAALKKPAQVKGVTATAEATKITVKWNKVSKNVKGYTVYRNGKTIARVGKSQTSYTDAGLTPNTSYSYTVKAYNTQTKYYNSKTKKWVTKKPKKSQWKGKKSKKSYKYSKASAAVAVKTKKASSSGNETGESWTTTDYLGMSWQMRRDSNGKDYIAYEIKNGQVSASGRVVKAEDYPRYDKTSDGEFGRNERSRFLQRGGVAFYVQNDWNKKITDTTTHLTTTMYGGEKSRLRIDILNPTQQIQLYDPYDKSPFQENVVVKGDVRTCRFWPLDSKEVTNAWGVRSCYIGYGVSTESFTAGFIGDVVSARIWYDFNGDGSCASGEVIQEGSVSLDPDPTSVALLEVAKKAIAANGGQSNTGDFVTDYRNDMIAIGNYISSNYCHGEDVEGSKIPMSCQGGALALYMWSVYRYNVYGVIGTRYQYHNPDHVDFHPHAPDKCSDFDISGRAIYYSAQGGACE